jgi:hypothetical protein
MDETGRVSSSDGTSIAFERQGAGLALYASSSGCPLALHAAGGLAIPRLALFELFSGRDEA